MPMRPGRKPRHLAINPSRRMDRNPATPTVASWPSCSNRRWCPRRIMALFLSPYSVTGTHAEPFRPRGGDQPGVSAIDIRLDPTRADGAGIGFAVLWVPDGTADPLGTTKIADDYGDPLTALIRSRLNTRTGLDFSQDVTIQDALETLLLRPDTGNWRQLRPANGRLEAWLGSGAGKRRWVDSLIIAGGSISDDFNRANETPLASPWTQLSGSGSTIKLASNAVTHASDGDTFYYYANGGGWNADQTSEWAYASKITSDDWGPAVRVGASGFSGYWYGLYAGGPQISKYIAGSYSIVELFSHTASVGVRYKRSATGSTLRYYDDGTELASSPATDTSLTTAGNGPGVFMYDTGGSLDDFLATGEITGGGGAGILLTPRHPM